MSYGQSSYLGGSRKIWSTFFQTNKTVASLVLISSESDSNCLLKPKNLIGPESGHNTKFGLIFSS